MQEATAVQTLQRTILVVDDDAVILSFISGFLVERHYNVLTAKDGAEGLQKSKDFKGEIHLLLSDFQMGEMTGMELATEITALRPKIKVLLMSGYPGGTLVLNEGWHFLAKPFVPSQLSALITGLVDPDKKSKF
jgi:DNA-binding NtrC family response regulator